MNEWYYGKPRTAQETVSKMERPPTKWGENVQVTCLIRVNTQNKLKRLNREKNPFEKWTEELNRPFPKKTNGQQTHEKVLNTTTIRKR